MAKLDKSKEHNIETLYLNIKGVIENTRNNVYTAINSETIKANWEIGRYIVEEEQQGKARAVKGDALIKKLSEKLTQEFGSGFDSTNLKRMRKFYLIFPKGAALRSQLSWTHYRILLKVESEKAREFYINEAVQGRWGTRTLERAILTKLYERMYNFSLLRWG